MLLRHCCWCGRGLRDYYLLPHTLSAACQIAQILSGRKVRWPRRMLSLVSHGKYADGTYRWANGKTPDRYITLSAWCGQRYKRLRRHYKNIHRVIAIMQFLCSFYLWQRQEVLRCTNTAVFWVYGISSSAMYIPSTE